VWLTKVVARCRGEARKRPMESSAAGCGSIDVVIGKPPWDCGRSRNEERGWPLGKSRGVGCGWGFSGWRGVEMERMRPSSDGEDGVFEEAVASIGARR